MSQQPATSDNTVSREEILEVANLARLGVDESTADSYADDISKVLKLMDTLSNVDTTDIKPLANIHDLSSHAPINCTPISLDQL